MAKKLYRLRKSAYEPGQGRWIRHRIVVSSILLMHIGGVLAALIVCIQWLDLGMAPEQGRHLAQFAMYPVEPVQGRDGPEAYAGAVVLLTFAMLGSLYRTTREFVKASGDRRDYPPCWYFTRPLQGVLLGTFLYVALKAGQFAIYDETIDGGVNVYALALLGALTGAFSERAYQSLQGLVNNVFKAEKHEQPG